MAEAMELLERRYGRVRELDGVEVLHELRKFYELITAGPRPLVAALSELRVEATAYEHTFDVSNDQLTPQLIELRDALVELAPTADDSGVPRPSDSDLRWTYGLSNFDQLASGGPDRLVENSDRDPSAAGMMLNILQSKLNQLRYPASTPDSRPDTPPDPTPATGPQLNDLARRLGNAADRHRHDLSTFRQAVEGRGGFQVQWLDMAIEQMNPKPREVHTDEDRRRWLEQLLMRSVSGWATIEAALSGQLPNTDIGRHQLEILIRRLKDAADAVYEDIHLKLESAPQTYPQRATAWVKSSGYGYFATACAGGLITAVAKGELTSAGVFIAIGVAIAMLPPLVGGLPQLKVDTVSVAGACITAVAVIVVFLTVGFAASLVAGLLFSAVFVLGQRSRISADDAHT